MVRIELVFECSAPDGKCVFKGIDENKCVEMVAEDEEAHVCCWLIVTRKVEKTISVEGVGVTN